MRVYCNDYKGISATLNLRALRCKRLPLHVGFPINVLKRTLIVLPYLILSVYIGYQDYIYDKSHLQRQSVSKKYFHRNYICREIDNFN